MQTRSVHTRSAVRTLAPLFLAVLMACGFLFTTPFPASVAHAQPRQPQVPSRSLSGGDGGWITSAISDGNGDGQLDLFGNVTGAGTCDCIVSNSWNGAGWNGWSAHQPPVSPPFFTPGEITPAVVELSSGSFVLLQDIAGQLWEQIGSGKPPSWSAWVKVNIPGFPLAAAPTIVSWGGNRVDAFAWLNFFGAQMLHVWSDTAGAQWNWQLLGGFSNADTQFAPTVVSRGANQLDLFANMLNTNSQNEALVHESWNGSTWSGWQNIGGSLLDSNQQLTTNYRIVTLWPNQLEIFGTWSDHTLRYDVLTGTTWSGWASLGGYLISNPTAASWAYDSLTACALGSDAALWCRDELYGSWGNWYSLGGGPFGADPAYWGSTPQSVATDVGTLDVFAVSTGNIVWQREGSWDSYSGSWSWTPWQTLGYPIV